MTKKIGLCLSVILLFSTRIFTQRNDPDFFESIGKIYVVVGVLAIIFLILIGYLIYLDRKISKLEKSQTNAIKTN